MNILPSSIVKKSHFEPHKYINIQLHTLRKHFEAQKKSYNACVLEHCVGPLVSIAMCDHACERCVFLTNSPRMLKYKVVSTYNMTSVLLLYSTATKIMGVT